MTADIDTYVLPMLCPPVTRATFTELLGPLDKVMTEAKSAAASAQRLGLLKPRGSAAAAARPRADIVLKVCVGLRFQGSGFMWLEIATLDPAEAHCWLLHSAAKTAACMQMTAGHVVRESVSLACDAFHELCDSACRFV